MTIRRIQFRQDHAKSDEKLTENKNGESSEISGYAKERRLRIHLQCAISRPLTWPNGEQIDGPTQKVYTHVSVIRPTGFTFWRIRIKSDIGVTLHPSSLRRTVSTPHSLRTRKPWSRAFYESVGNAAFYEFINLKSWPLKKEAPLIRWIRGARTKGAHP